MDYRDVDAIDHPVPPNNHANSINYVQRQDGFELFRRLEAAAAPCLSPGDRKIIEIELRSDDLYYAIDDIVRAAARKRFPLPAPLVAGLHTWLNSYENTEDEPRFRRLINQRSQPAPEASRRVWTLPSF